MSKPIPYTCGDCGATGVKLWRDAQFVATAVTLRCCDCALRHLDLFGVVAICAKGKSPSLLDGQMSDQLYNSESESGSLLPAVPADGGSTFWGYTSVPDRCVEWWRNLPLRIPNSA